MRRIKYLIAVQQAAPRRARAVPERHGLRPICRRIRARQRPGGRRPADDCTPQSRARPESRAGLNRTPQSSWLRRGFGAGLGVLYLAVQQSAELPRSPRPPERRAGARAATGQPAAVRGRLPTIGAKGKNSHWPPGKELPGLRYTLRIPAGGRVPRPVTVFPTYGAL